MVDLIKASLIETLLERHRAYQFYLGRAYFDLWKIIDDVQACKTLCELARIQVEVVAVRVIMQTEIVQAVQREPKI